MACRTKIITPLILGFALTAGVYADMMPACYVDAARCPAAPAGDRTVSPSSTSPSPLLGPTVVDLHLRPIAFLPTTNAAVEETGETQPPLQLLGPDRSSSFDLCLYALMGLGLCRSVPLVKKLSLGCIPDWYHAGAPSQIGPSHVAEPNCLCSAAVCFVQPDDRAEDSIPQHRFGTIASLWRTSQCRPSAFASRAPPFACR